MFNPKKLLTYQLVVTVACAALTLNCFSQRLEITPGAETSISCTNQPLPCTWSAQIGACGSVNFLEVQVGFSKTLSFDIGNSDFLAQLDITKIEIVDGSKHFFLRNSSGDNVTSLPAVSFSGVGSQTIEVVFHPDLKAITSASTQQPFLDQILIESNTEPCYPDADGDNSNGSHQIFIDLIGVAKRNPVHYGLTLDKSGSMDLIVTGSTTRLDLLKSAAKYFIDLVNDRNDPNGTDQLAAVSFSTTASPLIDLSPIDPTMKTTIDDLASENLTAVGQGLELTDLNMGAAPVDGINAILLFTDGEENVPPYMADITINNNPKIFTIGMGTSSSSQTKLSNLATAFGGAYYQVPDGMTYTVGVLPIELQKAYLGIFASLTSMEEVIDPIFQVSLGSSEVLVSSAQITSSDSRAVFTVFEKEENRGFYETEIRSPGGTIIKNGTLAGGLIGRITQGETYTIYSVDFPNSAADTTYQGQWELILKPPKDQMDAQKIVPVGFAAIVLSDLKLDVMVGSEGDEPGSEIEVSTDVIEEDEPGGDIDDVQVTVTTPSNITYPVKSQKNSLGRMVAKFPDTHQAGTYRIFVRAQVKNRDGQVTTREKTRHIALGKAVTPAPDPCVPCQWIKILIVVFVILAIVLIVMFYRKRSTR